MIDVIIIGGGLSGLTTAYKILQKEPSLRLKILEENDSIGGQIASSKPDEELGGRFLIPDQTHIYNLLTDLGIHMRRRVLVSRNLKRSWVLDNGVFAYFAKFELERYMKDLNLKSQLYRPGTYDLLPEDRKYKMWHHIKANMFFESSRNFIVNLVRLVTGVHARDISYVEFMNTLHSCGGLQTLMELKDTIQITGKSMIDVIIIGAGLSGLTTAYIILQKEPSLSLEILEANDTIGGQIASSNPDEELGGRFLIPDQTHIYNLLTDLGIHMRRRVLVSENLKRSWTLDKGVFAFAAKFELERFMKDLNLKALLFRPGTYDLVPEDKKYTIWHHIKANMFFESSRIFMMNIVRLITGVHARDISFVEFMNILHSCGGLKTLMELYVEPSQRVLEFSSDQLLGAFDNRLESVSIQRLTKVIEIRHHEDFVQVSQTNGTIHTAKVAVLAIPCNHIEDIFITPSIPMELELPYLGDKYYITSFRVNYDEPHWRRRGFSGNFYSANPAIFAQQHKQTSLVGNILHGAGFELLIKSIVLKSLAESFGNEMTEPVTYNQQTYEQTSLMNLPYTSPWNRVIWSSTSTATLYRGCLNGAVQSGLRAAIHALLILRPQSVTWQDLAEIQKASVVYRYPSHWNLLKSSMNIYNTSFYSIVAVVILCLLKYRNKIFH